MSKQKDSMFRVSPVHRSNANGVHADYYGVNGSKEHIPFVGQTTLDVFTRPSYENDVVLKNMGGVLKGDK